MKNPITVDEALLSNSQQIQDTASTQENQELSMLTCAIALVEKGYSIFPCDLHKKPLVAHGYKHATRDLEQIKKWWTLWPFALVGVPTGAINGVDVLDVDPRNGGDTWYNAYKKYLPITRVHETPSGGYHLFFYITMVFVTVQDE